MAPSAASPNLLICEVSTLGTLHSNAALASAIPNRPPPSSSSPFPKSPLEPGAPKSPAPPALAPHPSLTVPCRQTPEHNLAQELPTEKAFPAPCPCAPGEPCSATGDCALRPPSLRLPLQVLREYQPAHAAHRNASPPTPLSPTGAAIVPEFAARRAPGGK